MRKIVSIIIFNLLFVIPFYGQADEKNDSIKFRFEENVFLKENQVDSNRFPLQIQQEENTPSTLSPEELKRREEFVKTLSFQVPKLYVGPVAKDIKLGKILPNNDDYYFYNFTPLNEEFATASSSTHISYPVGDVSQIDLNITYTINDWLTVTGGVYMAKYRMPGSPLMSGAFMNNYNDFGINTSFNFKLTDRLYLKAFGRYSVNMNDRSRPFMPAMEGIFPQTHYGGGFEYKINDKFGVEGGLIREFNPMRRKWTTRPYVAPIFYK